LAGLLGQSASEEQHLSERSIALVPYRLAQSAQRCDAFCGFSDGGLIEEFEDATESDLGISQRAGGESLLRRRQCVTDGSTADFFITRRLVEMIGKGHHVAGPKFLQGFTGAAVKSPPPRR
jgi:hypothetical protein